MDLINKKRLPCEGGITSRSFIFGYSKVKITLFIHAIDGLSENDFIMAAKIDEL